MAQSINKTRKRLLSAQEQIVNAFDEFKSEYRKGMQKIDKQLEKLGEVDSDDEGKTKKGKERKKIRSYSSTEEDEKPIKKKTRKEKKAERDPNMPTRPAGAYFLYQKDTLKQRMAENAGVDHHDVQKIVGAEWKAMTDNQKLPWTRPYEAEKKKYDLDMIKYNTSKGIKGTKSKKKNKKQVVVAPVEDDIQVDDEDAQKEQGVDTGNAEDGSDLSSDAESDSDELDSDDSESTTSTSTDTAQTSKHVKSSSSKQNGR
ncbi:hypothetical protein JCM5353_002659 [Sporobolomyces roseus]